MERPEGSKRTRLFHRAIRYNRIAQLANDAEDGGVHIDLRERYEREGVIKAAKGVGILAIRYLPMDLEDVTGRLVLGKGRKFVGSGAEAIVVDLYDDGRVQKLIPVGPATRDQTTASLREDLALIREYMPGRLPDTHIYHTDARVGMLKGPFVVVDQERLEGEDLFQTLAKGEPDERLLEEIEGFLAQYEQVVLNAGRRPDIVGRSNLMVIEEEHGPHIMIPDFSMHEIGFARTQGPDSNHYSRYEQLISTIE